jgi:holo-[acyl-carrier protein] synthase
MIKGIGTDIIEIERVKQKVDKPLGFKEKVFSSAEINICEAKGALKYQSYAGRFVAKEAFLKAVGISWIDEFNLNEIEVLNEESGKPFFQLRGSIDTWAKDNKISSMHLSISHSKEYATAIVILEHE